jgi:hypothetical protein
MLSPILVVLDEHADNREMIAFAAELAGPTSATILVSHDGRSGPSLDDPLNVGSDVAATRVRRTVDQLTSVGLSARAATRSESHGDLPLHIARVAAMENAGLIISRSEDALSLPQVLPRVVSRGVLQSREGPVAVVRTSGKGQPGDPASSVPKRMVRGPKASSARFLKAKGQPEWEGR